VVGEKGAGWKVRESSRELGSPNAVYAYDGENHEQSSFSVYTRLMKAVISGNSGLDIADDWFSFTDSYYFERKHDHKTNHELSHKEIIDAIRSDDFDVVGNGAMTVLVQSRKPRHTVYFLVYSAPSFWDTGGSRPKKRFVDGTVKIAAAEYHTKRLHGNYDEDKALAELKQIVYDYGKYHDNSVTDSNENYAPKAGKGTNSGVHFRAPTKKKQSHPNF